MTFDLASAVTASGDGRFIANIPDGWQQGRGAFGGLVLAILLRAIQKSEPDRARTPRSLIGELAGPVVSGEAEIVVTVLRRGANQSNIRADLRQNGEVLAFASAVLSSPRVVGIPNHIPKVTPPPIGDATVVPIEGPLPKFTKNFIYSINEGVPFTGSEAPVVSAWIRTREVPAAIDHPLLVGYLDAYWPAFFPVITTPRPIATIAFTAEFMCDPRSLDPAAHYHYRGRTVSDHEGFQLELRDLYDAHGTLIASNQQTFVVIK
jgi:acyl-CoA thioesterase